MVEFNYDSAAWRRIRLKVLERDGYLCQVRAPGCAVAADRVDHIVPLRDGGSLYDESNLRASCRPCNKSRATPRAAFGGSPPPSREW